MCFMVLVDYFLSHVREVFSYYLFKYFIESFPLYSPSGTHPYNVNFDASNVVPEASEMVFISFILFFYILFCGSNSHQYVLQVISLFLFLSYSAMDCVLFI